MITHWIQPSLLVLGIAIAVQFINIKLAHRFNLMDIPSARRRHLNPTPVTGGVGVLLSWIVGLGVFYANQPDHFQSYSLSISVLVSGTFTLMILGLVDDLKGLSPSWKLSVEGLVAIGTLVFEPQLHALCIQWSKSIGSLVWVLGVIWIVGIINCLNLIDGLDGLAGGTSLLILGAISLLCRTTSGSVLELPLFVALPLIMGILPFLRKNWHRAQIFLGDNGSLPMGYLIATTSLLCHPKNRSWIMVASIILMLGYPILDTGLAVLRRYQKKQPLFKADRNHLHYRIQRLGLNVPQTALLLLSISLLLQLTSIGINFVPAHYAVVVIAAVVLSLSSLFHLIYSVEASRVGRLIETLNVKPIRQRIFNLHKGEMSIHIEIDTLLEAGMMEEQSRYKDLFSSLNLLLLSCIRSHSQNYGSLYFKNHEVIITINQNLTSAAVDLLIEKIRGKISGFLELYELQCSLASIPIRVQRGSPNKLKKAA